MRLDFGAVIVGAGRGTRLGLNSPKCFWEVGGVPLMVMATFPFQTSPFCREIVWVVPREILTEAHHLRERFRLSKLSSIVPGGERRQDSVIAGAKLLINTQTYLLIHDGARPFVTHRLIERCIQALPSHPAVLPALTPPDTLHLRIQEWAQPGMEREQVVMAQTPQGFQSPIFQIILTNLSESSPTYTDEVSALFHITGRGAYIIEGERTNVKITYPEDLTIYQTPLLKRAEEALRELCR